MNTTENTNVAAQGMEQASAAADPSETVQKPTSRKPWIVRLRYALLACIAVSSISLASFTLSSIKAMESEFNGIHTNLLVRVQPLTQPQIQTTSSASVVSEHLN